MENNQSDRVAYFDRPCSTGDIVLLVHSASCRYQVSWYLGCLRRAAAVLLPCTNASLNVRKGTKASPPHTCLCTRCKSLTRLMYQLTLVRESGSLVVSSLVATGRLCDFCDSSSLPVPISLPSSAQAHTGTPGTCRLCSFGRSQADRVVGRGMYVPT